MVGHFQQKPALSSARLGFRRGCSSTIRRGPGLSGVPEMYCQVAADLSKYAASPDSFHAYMNPTAASA